MCSPNRNPSGLRFFYALIYNYSLYSLNLPCIAARLRARLKSAAPRHSIYNMCIIYALRSACTIFLCFTEQLSAPYTNNTAIYEYR
jgi:hypothetical protein